MQTISDKLINIAKQMYKGRDKSHGITHALNVSRNSLFISNELNIKDKLTLLKIESAALYHDLWDHKYINSNSDECKNIKKKLHYYLKRNFFSDHDIQDIIIIIDNISLSKEIERRNNSSILDLKHLQLIRDIVSDADKLEMLGNTGINRIFQFEYYNIEHTEELNQEHFKNVFIDIYNRKLSKLLKENYIITEPAIKMAIPLMEETEHYLNTIKHTTDY
jgi:HD superfamily phosphodiesterase